VRQALASLLSDVQQYGLRQRRGGAWRSRRGRRKILFAAMAAAATALTVGVAAWFASGETGSKQIQSPPTATAIDAEALAGAEAVFFDNLEAAQKGLDGAVSESIYLQDGDDLWRREVQALERDLERIEGVNR